MVNTRGPGQTSGDKRLQKIKQQLQRTQEKIQIIIAWIRENFGERNFLFNDLWKILREFDEETSSSSRSGKKDKKKRSSELSVKEAPRFSTSTHVKPSSLSNNLTTPEITWPTPWEIKLGKTACVLVEKLNLETARTSSAQKCLSEGSAFTKIQEAEYRKTDERQICRPRRQRKQPLKLRTAELNEDEVDNVDISQASDNVEIKGEESPPDDLGTNNELDDSLTLSNLPDSDSDYEPDPEAGVDQMREDISKNLNFGKVKSPGKKRTKHKHHPSQKLADGSEESTFIFACTHCESTFTTSLEFVKHQLLHDLVEDGPSPTDDSIQLPTVTPTDFIFACTNCDLTFTTSVEFVKHQLVHDLVEDGPGNLGMSKAASTKTVLQPPNVKKLKRTAKRPRRYRIVNELSEDKNKADNDKSTKRKNIEEDANDGHDLDTNNDPTDHLILSNPPSPDEMPDPDYEPGQLGRDIDQRNDSEDDGPRNLGLGLGHDKGDAAPNILITQEFSVDPPELELSKHDDEPVVQQPEVKKLKRTAKQPRRYRIVKELSQDQKNGDDTTGLGEPKQRYSRARPNTALGRPCICELCGKMFNTPYYIKQHMTLVHAPRQETFPCPKCDKVLATQGTLRGHMKLHDPGAKCHLCSECGQSFARSNALTRHMRTHDGIRSFKCTYCDLAFTLKDTLRKHISLHLGRGETQCSICGLKLSTNHLLKRHIKFVHENCRPFKCHLCEKAFKSPREMRNHVKRHDNPDFEKRCMSQKEVSRSSKKYWNGYNRKLRVARIATGEGQDGNSSLNLTMREDVTQSAVASIIVPPEVVSEEIV